MKRILLYAILALLILQYIAVNTSALRIKSMRQRFRRLYAKCAASYCNHALKLKDCKTKYRKRGQRKLCRICLKHACTKRAQTVFWMDVKNQDLMKAVKSSK